MTTTGWQHSHQRAQQAQQKMLRIRARPSAHKKINKPGTPTPSGGSPTQRLGKYYEQRAAQFLRRQGYQILHQQRHYRYGEIDLIAWSEPYLVLVEVRHRKHTSHGGARGSIGHRKKQRLQRAARRAYQEYQKVLQRKDFLLRVDVIAFEGQRLHWIPNALSYE